MRIAVIRFGILAVVFACCGWVRGEETADEGVYFVRDVMPLLTAAGCNASKCHGSVGGKGGFELSMFAADPAADHVTLTRSAEGRQINVVEPAASLFLRREITICGSFRTTLWCGRGWLPKS